jgi:hypothetical protein
MERTFPTGAQTPAMIRLAMGFQIFLGKVRSFTSTRRGPSTSSDHCSFDLSIELDVEQTEVVLGHGEEHKLRC